MVLPRAEDEGRQRGRLVGDPRQGVVEVCVCEDRQDGAEDLILHDLMFPGDGVEDGRRDIASFGIGITAGHDLRLIDQRVETLRLPGADDAGIVCPPSSSNTGVRCSAAAFATILPTLVLPVKKMKSNGNWRRLVLASRPPATAATAGSSK